MNKYRWVISAPDEGAPAVEAADSRIPPAGMRLFAARAMKDPAVIAAFLSPSADHAHDPFQFEHMREAVAIVDAAARSGGSLIVHGDYDVDGISGAALLYHLFQRRVQDRASVRAGPSQGRLRRGGSGRRLALEQKVSLFIAVDCGTSDAAKPVVSKMPVSR
jgi:single-stranded-DNA-specific exonuclease